MTPYSAIALQLAAQSVEQVADTAAARGQIMAQISALEPKIRSARIFVEQYGGLGVKLVVLPEYNKQDLLVLQVLLVLYLVQFLEEWEHQ